MKFLIILLLIVMVTLGGCTQVDGQTSPPVRWKYFEATVDAVASAETGFGRPYTVMWIEETRITEWGRLDVKVGQSVKVRQRVYMSGRSGKLEFLGFALEEATND